MCPMLLFAAALTQLPVKAYPRQEHALGINQISIVANIMAIAAATRAAYVLNVCPSPRGRIFLPLIDIESFFVSYHPTSMVEKKWYETKSFYLAMFREHLRHGLHGWLASQLPP